MSANLSRGYAAELSTFASKNIIVRTTTGKTIKGVLMGLNPDDMNIILGDVVIGEDEHHRLFLAGSQVAEITLGERPFDMNKLKMELERVFKKTGVRYFEDTRTIMVMDRYKVTEGSVDGDGPVADRIRRIWQSLKEEFSSTQEE
ncbi:MAG: Lsm family RNA-binding protein [Candidatus Kariarchaeaceae archaeon]|jgi:small nuclear ribonucleoprotein (snRNP)-like protein